VTARPRVLYADDEEDVREVFAAVFGADFDVTCVATGQEALELLASAPPWPAESAFHAFHDELVQQIAVTARA
jgi:CheY-like chemotaxis protein